LLFASKEIGLEVRADKIQNIFMSCDQNAGQSHKTDNSSFERVEQLRYLGTTTKNQNPIPEEIMGIRECLLSFCAETFVFQFSPQQYKD